MDIQYLLFLQGIRNAAGGILTPVMLIISHLATIGAGVLCVVLFWGIDREMGYWVIINDCLRVSSMDPRCPDRTARKSAADRYRLFLSQRPHAVRGFLIRIPGAKMRQRPQSALRLLCRHDLFSGLFPQLSGRTHAAGCDRRDPLQLRDH